MTNMYPLPRSIVVVATAVALIAALALAAACAGDSEPAPAPEPTPAAEPEPAPAAEPEPAPAPTPEPEPAPAAEPEPAPAAEPEPAASTPEPAEPLSMHDFVLDASTTGQDLVDRLSEEETACIKAALGDFVFGFLLGTPLLAAGSTGGSAAPIFNCLSVENVVLVGLAFSDTEAFFQDDASRECIKELALDHPGIILERLGLERDVPEAAPGDVQEFIIRLYECWSDEERIVFLVDFVDRLAEANPYLGRDLVALLPESEAACVMEQIPGEQYEAFLASNLTRGFGDQLHECFSDETHVQMFLALTQARVTGGLSDETVSCLRSFAQEHVHFVELSTTLDPATLAPDEFTEIGRDGLLMLQCMTEDELLRMQGVGAQGLAQ